MNDYVRMLLEPKTISVPSDWNQNKFSSVARINPSYDVPKREEYAYVPMDSVEEGTGRIRYWERREESELTNTCFSVGDTFFAKITPSLKNGKVAYVDTLPEGHELAFGSTEFIVFSPKKEQLDSLFLYYMVSKDLIRAITASMMQGSTNRQRVPLNIFRRALSIPTPPLPEQKHIARILSKVDEAIQKTDEIIEAATRLKRGLMQELLTRGIGHTEYKEVRIGPKEMTIPVSWDLRELKDVTTTIYRYTSYYGIDYLGAGVPEIRGEMLLPSGDISNDDLRYISEETAKEFPRTSMEVGDIIMSVRGTMGKIGIVDKSLEGATIIANLIRISPNSKRVQPDFFRWLLIAPLFQNQVQSYSYKTTISTIKSTDIEDIQLPIPPLGEQSHIADIISTVEGIIQKEKVYEHTLQKLKKGLMQDLLTGKVRVKTDSA